MLIPYFWVQDMVFCSIPPMKEPRSVFPLISSTIRLMSCLSLFEGEVDRKAEPWNARCVSVFGVFGILHIRRPDQGCVLFACLLTLASFLTLVLLFLILLLLMAELFLCCSKKSFGSFLIA